MEEVELATLQAACRTLARSTLWSEQGTPEIAVAKLAGEFLQVASDQLATVVESGRDPHIVTRAICYLAHTHVIPSRRMAKWWFTEMLACLVELAVPSIIQTPASAAFLRDVHEGIANWTDS
ncbi:hypothetical protein YH64_016420 [Achromobacter sp. LC458]|jgi:hypothetical protein|uniref:hypothetical protein n=1 Tax=Achromobacter TaxID=222 RepID=UPI000A5D249E|nr:hypothetical protein [Achromobacter sp. LC458]TRM51897.1 hypothetical protein YH64_016420 [Achromobacter sp. LC458]